MKSRRPTGVQSTVFRPFETWIWWVRLMAGFLEVVVTGRPDIWVVLWAGRPSLDENLRDGVVAAVIELSRYARARGWTIIRKA